MSKYLEFTQVPFNGKTQKFLVHSKSQSMDLGEIKWHSAWRQYCFYPDENTLWSHDCLKDIQDFLQQLMDERK